VPPHRLPSAPFAALVRVAFLCTGCAGSLYLCLFTCTLRAKYMLPYTPNFYPAAGRWHNSTGCASPCGRYVRRVLRAAHPRSFCWTAGFFIRWTGFSYYLCGSLGLATPHFPADARARLPALRFACRRVGAGHLWIPVPLPTFAALLNGRRVVLPLCGRADGTL